MARKQQQPDCRPLAAATELQNSRERLQDLRCSKSEEANRSDEPKECKSMQRTLYHLQVAANDGFAATTRKQTNKTNSDAAGRGHGVCRRRRGKKSKMTHPPTQRKASEPATGLRERHRYLPACLQASLANFLPAYLFSYLPALEVEPALPTAFAGCPLVWVWPHLDFCGSDVPMGDGFFLGETY